MPRLISEDSRRTEPAADDPHYHLWTDRGLVMIAQRPRFGSSAAARNAAKRAQMQLGTFEVKQCALPCRFTVKRKRTRKRKPCRHCGRLP